MDALAYGFKDMCDHNRDGSYATQDNRRRTANQVAGILKKHGYNLPSPKSIKPKHGLVVIKDLQAEGISVGRQKNVASFLRWWAGKVGKDSVIPRKNEQLGIASRGPSKVQAQKLDVSRLEKIDCPKIRRSVQLQAAFGMRREAAIKYRPSIADKGDRIELKDSWNKGGKAHTIPVRTAKQRALLDAIKQEVGDGSLIAKDTYEEHLRDYKNQTTKAGLTHLHTVRHNYAQALYKTMTGWECPKSKGEKLDLTPEQRKIDAEVRLMISKELGHERIEITNTYLGYRG